MSEQTGAVKAMDTDKIVWGKLSESSDLTRDLLSIYDKAFFVKFVKYFDADPLPLDLVEVPALCGHGRFYCDSRNKK